MEDSRQPEQRLGFLTTYYAKTNALLKKVEWIDEGLTIPVVNELRSVGYHLLLYIGEQDKDKQYAELEKAIGHVKRAYFDINEIVLLAHLERVANINESVEGYSYILAKHIENYSQKRKAVFEAKSLIESPIFDPVTTESRENHFELLEEPVNNLRDFIESFDEVSDMILDEIRQLKNQNTAQTRGNSLAQIVIWITVVGVLGTLLGLLIG